jgi:tight adherence protein B
MQMVVFIFVGVLVIAAVAVLLVGLRRTVQPTDVVEARIQTWVGRGRRDYGLDGEKASRQRRQAAPEGWRATIARDLARADLSLTVGEYLAIRIGVVVVAFLAGFLARGNLVLGLLLGLVAHFIPPAYLRLRQARRLQAFNRQLPDVLDQIVGSLRVGYGLTQSLEWVAEQMPPPAGAEFDRVIREIQLGQALPVALDNMVRRIGSDDLAMIVTAIKIQHESGGSLAEILETVAHTIRERVRIQREINVLTAQQRYSGYTMMLLPIALAIFLMLMNPEYEMQLFTPGPTLCIPIGTGLMMIAGFFAMRRIVNIEV